MVDYLAAPTAGPAHIRDLQSCSTSIAAKIIVLEGVCALVISATFHLKTLDLVQCSQCSVTVKSLPKRFWGLRFPALPCDLPTASSSLLVSYFVCFGGCVPNICIFVKVLKVCFGIFHFCFISIWLVLLWFCCLPLSPWRGFVKAKDCNKYTTINHTLAFACFFYPKVCKHIYVYECRWI